MYIVLFSSIELFAADFTSIDEMVNSAIVQHVFPSAQIVIGDKNNILYSKAYGNYTYEDGYHPVTTSSPYDLASLTKDFCQLLRLL